MSPSIGPRHSWEASPTPPSSVVIRSTAVVRAGAEPRSPRLHAYGGETGGSGVRSTSTAAICMRGDHHTNDQPLSRPLELFLSFDECSLDVGGDPLAGKGTVSGGKRVVDRLVLPRRLLECL